MSLSTSACALRASAVRLLPRAAVALYLPLLAATLPAQPANLQWSPLKEPSVGGWTVALRVSPQNSSRLVVSGDLLGAAASADAGQSWTQSRLSDGTSFKCWEMNDFTWDTNDATGQTVWLASCDGPHKSSDAGLTYARKRASLPTEGVFQFYGYPIQKILVDPANPQRLLAFGGSKRNLIRNWAHNYGAIWQSLDGGQTWADPAVTEPFTTTSGSTVNLAVPWRRLSAGSTVLKNNELNITAASYAGVSTSTIYVSVFGYGVYKSINSGDTWTTVNGSGTGALPNLNAACLAVYPTNADTLFVALKDQGVYKSVDGGASWTRANGFNGTGVAEDLGFYGIGNGNSGDGWLTITPNGTLYYAAYSRGRVYRSSDLGDNWTEITSTLPAGNVALVGGGSQFDPCVLSADPSASNTVYVGGQNIVRSIDAGASWNDISSSRPDAANRPANWRGRGFSGWVSTNFKWNPSIPGTAYFMAMDAGKAWISDDNLLSWKKPSGLYGFHGTNDITFGDNGLTTYVANGQFSGTVTHNDGYSYSQPFKGIAKSTDGGNSYTYTGWPADAGGVAIDALARSIYTLPDATARVWAVIGGTLYYSATSGSPNSSWTPLTVGASATVYEIAAPLSNLASSFVIYVSASSGVYKSVNGTDFTLLPSTSHPTDSASGFVSLAVDPNNPAVLLACNGNTGNGLPGLWRYNGTAWGRLAAPTFAGSKAIDKISSADVRPGNSNEIALVTNWDSLTDFTKATGVWVTTDLGATWYQRNTGIGVTRGRRIRYSPDGSKLVMGSNGGGFYVANTDGTAQAGTQTLAASADAYVRNGVPTTNFGGDPTLQVKNYIDDGYLRESYLRFPVANSGLTIQSAKVRLYGSQGSGGSGAPVGIYGVSDTAWTESGVNWGNKPVSGAIIGSGVTVTTTAQYYEWDVTAYVQSRLNAGATEVDFAMKGINSIYQVFTFNSDEASTNKPQLVIVTQ